MNKKFKSNRDVFQKAVSPGERVEQILSDADIKSNYLPKSTSIEDVDFEIDRQFKEDEFALILEGEGIVPSIFLNNERWGEFSKTWKLMDQDKNVVPPYITINKVPNYKQGSYSAEKYNIPKKYYNYVTVPYFENGGYGYEIYSIPQPVAIDLTYEIRIFTPYVTEVNAFVELFFRNFSSLQYYIKVNGQFFRITMEDTFNDESTVENIDKERYYVSVQTITVKAYLQNEKDFKMVRAYNRVGINIKTDDGKNLGTINT